MYERPSRTCRGSNSPSFKLARVAHFRGGAHRVKTSGEAKAELLAKCSGRERRLVNDVLHRASKIIARITAEEGAKPVMIEVGREG